MVNTAIADQSGAGDRSARPDADREYDFEIPSEPLAEALTDFSQIAARQIIFSEDSSMAKMSPGLHGRYTVSQALSILLQDTGWKADTNPGGVLMIRRAEMAPPAPKKPVPVAAAGTSPDKGIPVSVGFNGIIETVVVSASRITARGFSAPTPTTVVSISDIQDSAQPNVFNAIDEFPSLQGSTGSTVGNGGTSSGNNGISTFNMRGLGTPRTLTLIDGQRVVPAYVTGIADVSEFPQLLIQRVDIVTGGASASWGSDAVGGVVNFITDKNFNGLKGNFQSGISTYGDDANALAQMAWGTGLFGDKGHVEASLEYYHNDGIPTANLPGGALPNGRCCQLFTGGNTLAPLAYTPSTTPPGAPEITYLSGPLSGSQNATFSTYGLIIAGPLKGISFNANGTPVPFQYGATCVGTICSGGDLSNTYAGSTLDAPLTRAVFYTRLSYRVTPAFEVYGTFNISNVDTANQPNAGHAPPAPLTIQCGNAPGGPNAYLPASINAACMTNGITSFAFGVSGITLQKNIRVHSLRQQRRYVAGTDGSFNMLGSAWTFDAYFQHGENDTSVHIKDISLQPNYVAAVDAIAGPNGTIVCRSAVPGCQPINFFGNNPVDPAAYAFVNPAQGPYQLTAERQEAASIAINSSPFGDWAGNVTLALGTEYREEAYRTVGDPYGNGVSPDTPNTPQYPANPLLSISGNNWYAGNFHNGSGNYHVYEMFLEAGIPLLNDIQWGKVDLDVGGRGTQYSTSGFVDTWKVGLTWDTPLNGVRLRTLQSRDVRAPNLNELFAAPLAQSQPVIDRISGAQPRVLVNTTGNPNLKPETAQTSELGVVYRPSYLAGLNFSIDYYRVGVKREIASLTSQQEIDLCQVSGNQSYCSLFSLAGANPFVDLRPFNLVSVITDGFDVELSYQFEMQKLGLPGKFAFRGLSTHVSKFITDAGVPGQPLTESAGAFTTPAGTSSIGGVPLWKNYLAQSWISDSLSFFITERFYSDGAINPYAIACQAPNCPAPTIQNPTVNMNHTQGPFFIDIGGSYSPTSEIQLYFKVDNITDYEPRAFAPIYEIDPIGRMYRIGVRFRS